MSNNRGAAAICAVVLDNFRSEKPGAHFSVNEHKTACFAVIRG